MSEAESSDNRGERGRLTDAAIKRLPVPAKGSRITYDGLVPGFGARVTAGGHRAFILTYRTRSGRERRYTIGGAGDWTVGAARIEARRLRHLIDQGGDPLADIEAERAAPTVSDLIARFIAEHVEPRTRPETKRAYIRILHKHIGPHFGKHTKVADVGFADIDALHRKITNDGAPYVANRCVAVMSKMFGLAVRWQMCERNPCRGIGRNYETKRKRYLDGDELARLTAALARYPEQQVSNIIRLALLTGARIGEVRAMRWADLADSDERGGTRTIWTKPASTTKQKADHIVPLSAPAQQLLAGIRERQAAGRKPLGEFVFPSYLNKSGHVLNIERPWRAICKAADITGLRVHDLRHSFASQLVSSGASLPLIGALLGHANVTTTSRYAHLFDDPLRKAVDSVGATIMAAGQPAPIPLRPRRRP
jgi:integrase